MKVIMLTGPSSCGKTTILNLVYDELIQAGAAITTARVQLGTNPLDFETELSYAKKGKTKKVAIFSMGDLANEVIGAMKKYAKIGVDVLIVACNDKFSSPMNALKQYPDSPPPVPKTKNPPAKRTVEDLKTARAIIALI